MDVRFEILIFGHFGLFRIIHTLFKSLIVNYRLEDDILEHNQILDHLGESTP
jgi:hypothetical protein